MTKYVELVVEDLRTRVRFPPTPPFKANPSEARGVCLLLSIFFSLRFTLKRVATAMSLLCCEQYAMHLLDQTLFDDAALYLFDG